MAGGLAAAAAGVVFAGAHDQCCYLNAPASSHLWHWTLGVLSLGGYESEAWGQYKAYMSSMAAAGHPFAIPLRMTTAAAMIIGSAAFTGWHVGKPRHSMKFISGNQLLEGNNAKKAAKKIKGKGIEIAPGLTLTDKRQTEHILIAGGTGSGKSVTGWNILIPAYNRGDRILLVNYKGMTEKFPVRNGAGDAEILCPWDSRSIVWQVSLDITTKTQAQTFAAAMIPESKDPLWSNAAREVLTGAMMMLIKTHGVGKWGWQDLADALKQTQPELLKMMRKFYPQGAAFVASEGKTTESVLMNLGAFTGVIFDLAEAWGNRRGFSVNAWVRNPKSKTRLVILNLSSKFTVLSKAFNVAVLSQIATTISDLPDVDDDKNPFWIYADEFPRLGKVDVWEDFLAVGRSKSFRLVFAFQSLSQLRHIYGDNISDTWVDSVKTKILGLQDGKGAVWVSEMTGKARWAIPQRTQSSGANASSSYSVSQPVELPVIEPHEVSTKLGEKNGCMRMLVHGLTPGFELLIDFPRRTLPDLRAATKYAKWCQEPNTPQSESMTLAPVEIQATQPEIEATKAKVITEEVTQSVDGFLPPAPPVPIHAQEKEFDKAEAQKEIIDEAAPSVVSAIAGDDVAHTTEALLKIAGLGEYAEAVTEAVIQDQPQQITTKRRKLVRKTQESEQEL